MQLGNVKYLDAMLAETLLVSVCEAANPGGSLYLIGCTLGVFMTIRVYFVFELGVGL